MVSPTAMVRSLGENEKPWTVTFGYRRIPNYTLLEYVCEDNREFADEKGQQKIRIDAPGNPGK